MKGMSILDPVYPRLLFPLVLKYVDATYIYKSRYLPKAGPLK